MTPQVATHIEDYCSEQRTLHGHEIVVTTYRLGRRYFCVVENAEVGATICRATGENLDEARRSALAVTERKLSLASRRLNLEQAEPCEIERIQVRVDGEPSPMPIQQFLVLSLRERMQGILGGSLTFLDSVGNSIPSGQAIEALSRAAMR